MKGNIDHVRALATSKSLAFLLRDVNGFTPFHLAVRFGYPKIAALLAEVSPPEVFHMETVVGDTAPETASHFDLLSRARTRLDTRVAPSGFRYNTTDIDSSYIPADSKALGEKTEALKITIDQLQKERRLTKGAKVTKALSAFADSMTTKAMELKVKEVELEKETKDKEAERDGEALEFDGCDLERTFIVVRKAIEEKPPMHRIPIPLAGVQRSVEIALPKREIKQDRTREHLGGFQLGEVVEDSDSGFLPSQRWLGDYIALVDQDCMQIVSNAATMVTAQTRRIETL